MLVFSVETSCDETSVCIINDKKTILSHIIYSQEEHNKFLLGLKIFGKNYNLIQNLIKTRTKVQIRSHSQKYFKKNI